MPGFYIGSGDLNSGPQASIAMTLSNKPFPQPGILLFKDMRLTVCTGERE